MALLKDVVMEINVNLLMDKKNLEQIICKVFQQFKWQMLEKPKII